MSFRHYSLFLLYITFCVLSIHNLLCISAFSIVYSVIINLLFVILAVVNIRFHRLKDLREDNDKFQKDVAEILRISQQYYSEYELGNRTIPTELLIKLAIYYNTSLDYIVGLTDDSRPYKRKK